METKHLIVDGLNVRYAERGSGPVVLLLHGWGTNLMTFDTCVAVWNGQEKHFIMLDMPGFGGSEIPPVAWDVSAYAVFVENFLVKLGVRKLQAVIGHSFGGRVAIKGIAKGNFKPERLVLIASAGAASQSSRAIPFLIAAKAGKVLTGIPPFSFFREQLRKKLYTASGSSDYLRAGPMKETFLNVIRENLTEDARTIDIPALLIWGEDDTETPLKEARILHDAIKTSTLDIFPHAGHFVHQEKSKEVAQKIADFLTI